MSPPPAGHEWLNRPVSAVLLDRDGTLNEPAAHGDYIRSPGDLSLLPGAAEAVRRLNEADVRTYVVTNQRGVSLGLMTLADLLAVHVRLAELLWSAANARLDDVEFCVHAENACECRKPLAGMAERLQSRHATFRPSDSVMIGDTERDVAFGRAVGARTIRLTAGSSSNTAAGVLTRADAEAPDLLAAVELILGTGAANVSSDLTGKGPS